MENRRYLFWGGGSSSRFLVVGKLGCSPTLKWRRRKLPSLAGLPWWLDFTLLLCFFLLFRVGIGDKIWMDQVCPSASLSYIPRYVVMSS